MSSTEKTLITNISRRDWLKFAGVGAATIGGSAFVSACSQQAAVADTADAPSKDALAIMSSNENPFGPSPKAIEAMKSEVANIYRYTYPSVMALTEQIAKRENVSPDQVLITNGSQPILGHFSVWANSKGYKILTSELTYEGVPRVAEAFGTEVDYSKVKEDLGYDLEAIGAKVGPGTCVYLCNPNNPTGKVIDSAELDAFVDAVSQKVPVFVDEAYLDIADDWEKQAMTKYVRMGRPVVVARTFSKIYGMAGQRVGYALMPAEMIKEFNSFQLMSNVNKLGLVAASASLDDVAHYEDMKAKITLGREKLVAMARDIGRPIAENPQGNFIYMDTGINADDFAKAMLAKGVRISGARWKERSEWSRICVGLPHEIEKCHEAAKSILTSI